MFLTRNEYDRGVNTFSPEGRLFQVEYAIEATKLGSTGISMQTDEGVVLVVEKRITSPLIVPSSIEKIFKIDDHIACAVSGLVADARTLIEDARAAAAFHWFNYNQHMRVEDITQSVSSSMLGFCKDMDEKKKRSLSRPYGVALLFAGIDSTGPALFHLDPSGTFIRYNAKAIGSGCEGAQQTLQEKYHSNMTLKEACREVLTILKQVMEEKLDAGNVEMVTVTCEKGFHLLTKEEVQEFIGEIPME